VRTPKIPVTIMRVAEEQEVEEAVEVQQLEEEEDEIKVADAVYPLF